MENRVVEKFRQYSSFRSKLLEKAILKLPPAAEYSSTFHSLILSTTVICIVTVYAQLRALTLFSLHPTCMIIGTFIFLSEGIVAYHNRSLLDTLSPIMQHNKKTKVRTLHQSLQVAGSTFLALGLLFIIANKVEFKHSIVPMSIHSIIGSFSLTLILVQIITGHQKMAQLDKNNSKIRRWHGDMGLLIWDMLCLAALTGLLSFLDLTLLHLVVELCVVVLWLAVHVQLRRKVVDRHGTQSDDQEEYTQSQPILPIFDDFAEETNRNV